MSKWDLIATDNIIVAVASLVCEGEYDNGDIQGVRDFFETMKKKDSNNIIFNHISNHLDKWQDMSDLEQTNSAMSVVDEYRVSYFMALMDLLSIFKEKNDEKNTTN